MAVAALPRGAVRAGDAHAERRADRVDETRPIEAEEHTRRGSGRGGAPPAVRMYAGTRWTEHHSEPCTDFPARSEGLQQLAEVAVLELRYREGRAEGVQPRVAACL